MIFAATVRQVLDGKKTQTRRPAGDETECRYKPGRTYAVQSGRGKPGVARIRILDTRREPVGQITFDDARAEGFRTTDAFKMTWVRLHDRDWLDREKIDVFADQLEAFGPGTVAFILTRRFDEQHADTLVWRIHFELVHHVEEELRLLTPAARPAGSTLGYTTLPSRAMSGSMDPGEAMDGAPLPLADVRTRDDAYLRRRASEPHAPPPPKPKPAPKPRPLLAEVRNALKITLAERYRGWEPEDVHADDPRFGSPGDIRALRRELGLRGTDGLEPIAPDELERTLDGMILRGASTRDVALAADWSQSKAQRWMAARQDSDASELAA